MRKYISYLVIVSIICLLVGCGKEVSTNDTTSSEAITNETTAKETTSNETISKETTAKEANANDTTSNIQEDTTGYIKVSVDYVSEEQLLQYEKVNEFVINDDGINLLILPTEELTNFSVNSIEIDETTMEYKTVSNLYELPIISPDEPVTIKLYMPDFPFIGISYTDDSGNIQEYGIQESLEDGSLSLFEMN